MGNLFNALNELKGNVFGNPSSGSTTPILRKTAIELADQGPTSRLGDDPFQFSSITYPRDVTNNMANGHYMLFYINVQNKTKFAEQYGLDSVPVNEYVETVDDVQGFTSTPVPSTPGNAAEINYRKGILNRGTKGQINTSDGADLRKGRTSQFQNNFI